MCTRSKKQRHLQGRKTESPFSFRYLSRRRRRLDMRPLQGQYHNGYQKARRHQHMGEGGADCQEAGQTAGLPVQGGDTILCGMAAQEQQHEQAKHRHQQHKQQHQRMSKAWGGQSMRDQGEQYSTYFQDGMDDTLIDQHIPPPPALTSRRGFQTKQLSPVMQHLMHPQQPEGTEGERCSHSPLIFPGDRHNMVKGVELFWCVLHSK